MAPVHTIKQKCQNILTSLLLSSLLSRLQHYQHFYLNFAQQVGSKSKPIRTELFQLQRDESESQHGATLLQQCIMGKAVQQLLSEQGKVL